MQWSLNRGFDKTNIGDSQSQVIAYLGIPASKTGTGEPFPRVTGAGCELPCVVRFWYENRLFLDFEAWSVDLDLNSHVVDKYHWVSP